MVFLFGYPMQAAHRNNAPIGHIQMDEALTEQRWMYPFTLDAMQSSLGGGYTLPKAHRKFLDCLQLYLCKDCGYQFRAGLDVNENELWNAYQQEKHTLAYTILNRVLTFAHRAFLLVHTNFDFWLLKCQQS